MNSINYFKQTILQYSAVADKAGTSISTDIVILIIDITIFDSAGLKDDE